MNNTSSKATASTKISIKHIDLQAPIRNLLTHMGENLEREGIKNTPKRFEKAMKYMLSGYDREFEDEATLFENSINYKDIVIFKNIDFFSMCEHHLLPFFGYVHIAYIPSQGKYLGISKLARVVDIYSKRLQTQEILSSEIANSLIKHAKAKGVAVLIEGRHLCAVARGVEKKVTVMSTCSYYGKFEENKILQQQFMELIRDREKVQ